MGLTFDLSQVDLFSQERLDALQTERFQKNLPFYLCEVQEIDRRYYFEGSRFCEYLFRNNNALPENPLTRRPVTSFTIYKSSKEADLFISVFNQDSMTPSNYLPVLWSDCSRADIERGEFYSRMGECYFLGTDGKVDKDEALHYYRNGAQLGYKNAQYNLLILLEERGIDDEFLYWSLKYLENLDPITVEDLCRCAQAFEKSKCKDHRKYAFHFFQKGALMGNPYCIAKIIRYYELGYGVARNPEKARLWRQYIPESWQEVSIRDYMANLCQNGSILKETKEDYIPLELQEDDGIKEINSDSLFSELGKGDMRVAVPQI